MVMTRMAGGAEDQLSTGESKCLDILSMIAWLKYSGFIPKLQSWKKHLN